VSIDAEITAFLRVHPASTARAICDALTHARGSIYRSISRLKATGDVVEETRPDERGNALRLLSLPETGSETNEVAPCCVCARKTSVGPPKLSRGLRVALAAFYDSPSIAEEDKLRLRSIHPPRRSPK